MILANFGLPLFHFLNFLFFKSLPLQELNLAFCVFLNFIRYLQKGMMLILMCYRNRLWETPPPPPLKQQHGTTEPREGIAFQKLRQTIRQLMIGESTVDMQMSWLICQMQVGRAVKVVMDLNREVCGERIFLHRHCSTQSAYS